VSRLLVALAVAGICAQPLYADVIPTRRAEDTRDASRKVESRLTQLGVSSEAAKDQLQKLTDDQTTYFAGSPERIQLVGQENFGGQSDNLWWEWVFGIAALVGVAVFIVIEVGKD
ncbi:MAG TPA: hypothetical protein VE981_14865, partial [Planctomycetota bacterium]|nr:hypothetical protein [Planctomycetota bacterium]